MTRYDTLVILGAAGDLTFRYLMPAAARLRADGLLSDEFRIVAVTRKEMDADEYRRRVADALSEQGELSQSTIDDLTSRISHEVGDATKAEDLRRALGESGESAVAYMALPPAIYGETIEAVAEAFPKGSRIVVEKPFGHDLDSARELNARLHRRFQERDVFRVDHFLGLAAVQAIPGLRFANRPFEQTWSRDHVERVDITWEETLALEGRAGYYDPTGALRDMVQNHLLEVLVAVAQEAPTSEEADAFRTSKCRLLQDVRRMSPDEAPRRVVRARYGAGRINGHEVPAYVDEEGVDPSNETETYVEMVVHIDNERWRGVPFVLRTGKALGAERHEVTLHYRPGSLQKVGGFERTGGGRLHIDLMPPAVRLESTVSTSRSLTEPAAITMRSDIPEGLPAYARVLLDVLAGEQALSVRDDEAEELWRIVDPVMEAWAKGEPPLLEYPAGSDGPPTDALELS